ncbi:MAG: hypothetical protein CMM02_04750 [Rhodopirellula sp.]|nr:hypothetical protein [Rhodopirellula sp.]
MRHFPVVTSGFQLLLLRLANTIVLVALQTMWSDNLNSNLAVDKNSNSYHQHWVKNRIKSSKIGLKNNFFLIVEPSFDG